MGDFAVFLSAEGYRHHIGLNTWTVKLRQSGVDLYLTSISYPSRKDLTEVLKCLLDSKNTLSGAADHGVSEGIYFEDPDDRSRVQLYNDRPRETLLKKEDGSLQMFLPEGLI